ncbi:iron-sulfur cluster biosynthesis family protein [Paenilisteria rocourtiae]|uniref:Uncharacterized protein YqkB n=1 Tax=Listeria rocourtiae TaxID=647910 RepID=A0A4R6ZM57_9LIST|nr:iron-sulfur cluster biosynthesis family protein [Listeria rocourtiae]EUJ44945.1 hypothetical protein PROCOU_12663 [Listeria rocourtiae FSL F6-920]MBC1603950.1 hypothetical protein [Listeria rocourtiae]TDR53541.1 uncharacterized protein YqkB [Listeria rocourtiae]
MNLTFTETAISCIDALRGNLPGKLYLYYLTEGCGCENSGIFTLKLATEATTEDIEFSSNLGPILIARWTAVFLEEQLKIDYNAKSNALILKSDSQFYNRNLLLMDANNNYIYTPKNEQ